MKCLNTQQRNKTLGLFSKVLLSFSVWWYFVLLGETKAVSPGSGSVWDGGVRVLLPTFASGVIVVRFQDFESCQRRGEHGEI